MNNINSNVSEAVRFLRANLTVKLIILFGSVAKGNDFADSDLDLAFLATHSVSNVQRWELAQELANKLHQEVDLVDLATVNDVFKFQIVSEGKVLYAQDGADDFMDRAYTTYLQLNDDRKEIIQNYA